VHSRTQVCCTGFKAVSGQTGILHKYVKYMASSSALLTDTQLST